MHLLNFNNNLLTDTQKLWIFNKIREFYKSDLYFSHIDTDFLMSSIADALFELNHKKLILEKVEASDYTNGLSILRKNKNSKPLLFEYPSITFQMKSLFELTEYLLTLYQNSGDLLKYADRSFGHKPSYFDIKSVKKANSDDIILNTSLKAPYQDQYKEFEKSVYNKSKSLLDDDEFKKVLVVQTDIESFYHNLDINELATRFNKKSQYALLGEYLNQIKSQFNFSSLPIGWIFSGFIADILICEYHDEIRRNLNKKFQEIIQNKEKRTLYLNKVLTEYQKSNTNLISNVEDFFNTGKIKFHISYNFVDDFIFLLSYSTQKKKNEYEDVFHTVAGTILIEAANECLKGCFELDSLRFYSLEEDKGKVLCFDKKNIGSLKDNFFKMVGVASPLNAEPNLWTRLDDFLLPIDNDLSLNEKNQFFSHINNYKKMLISGERIKKSERQDIFQKIKLKLDGDGVKYVHSVFNLIEAFLISDVENRAEYLKEINAIVDLFIQREHKLDLSLKLFRGYFNLYSKQNFPNDIKFFIHFNRFIQSHKQNISKIELPTDSQLNDLDLLDAVLQTYSFKVRKLTDFKKSNKIVSQTSSNGIISSKFSFLNSSKKNFDKIPVRDTSEIYSYSKYFASKVVHSKNFDFKRYGSLIENIFIQHGNAASDMFFRMTIVEVLIACENIRLGELADFVETSDFISNRVKIESIGCLKEYLENRIYTELPHSHKLTYLEKRFIDTIDSFKKTKTTRVNAEKLAKIISLPLIHNRKDLYKNSFYKIKSFLSARVFDFNLFPELVRNSSETFLYLLDVFKDKEIDSRGYFTRPLPLLKQMKKEIATEIGNYETTDPYLVFKRDGVIEIDIDKIVKRFGIPNHRKNYTKVTVAPIRYHWDETADEKRSNKFFVDKTVQQQLDYKIQAAIAEAIKQESSFIVFPELTLPRKNLKSYIDQCANANIILIAGLEYENLNKDHVINSTLISLPIDKASNPLQRNFVAFEQIKHYPAAVEKYILKTFCKPPVDYFAGHFLYIFKSKPFANFAILTCSDFLSLRLRLKIQERVQLLFVPAQNSDHTSYEHIAESSIRDLHCFTVICNNQTLAGSFIYAPLYSKTERVFLKLEGKLIPEFATVEIFPNKLLKNDDVDSQTPFRTPKKLIPPKEISFELQNLKQLPPDWGYPKKK